MLVPASDIGTRYTPTSGMDMDVSGNKQIARYLYKTLEEVTELIGWGMKVARKPVTATRLICTAP